ncbi:M20 family metallopeptidase [Nesterenkonia xinjiangensis]|uniref:Glutamate carboxypeptidase n=1 Tax=Nesterenkonia xinjiangensis TaxID=225327 RepID=A0A7Z0GM51_9MICC|nr:M20 family metallopeptidase [Nesterenkonia xinjiangensis]NYJ78524.1 glutamate carboxypeptidase [Nesterenkonia xinjiangensis]
MTSTSSAGPADAQPTVPLQALRQHAAAHHDEFLEDLQRIVHCETPSHDKALLDAGLEEIRTLAAERLGEPVAETRIPGGVHGDVLDLRWPGQGHDGGTVDDPAAAVLSVCHYDTVWPAGTLAGWPLTADGDRLTGPGVLDMKFGIVQTLWALRALRELGVPHPPVRLLLTGDEEIGSAAGRPAIEAAARESALTLVPEPSAGGQPKDRRKGMVFADLTVHGVQAHAGLEPEKGASAIHALAAVVPAIVGLAAPEEGTTVTVGTFHGGTSRNVIAGRAECQVDVRVTDPAEQERVAGALRGLRLPAPYDAEDRLDLVVEVDANRPPMNPTPASQDAMARLGRLAAALGRTIVPAAVGGASDANFVSALGLPVLDGLGAVGEGPHAIHEHILLSEIAPQTALLAGLLADVAQRP